MKTSDFDYDLPDAQIAQRPTRDRDGGRMLVVEERGCTDGLVRDWADAVEPGSLVVLNDTRVRRARLLGHRADTGGKTELLLLRRESRAATKERWSAMARAGSALKAGQRVVVGEYSFSIVDVPGAGHVVVEAEHGHAEAAMDVSGHVPLPPYVRRPDEPEDRERYQTVFAQHPGSAAAPTAGLHLTDAALDRLRTRGVGIGHVTLHVGAGTFLPVKTERLDDHPMHHEHFSVGEELVSAIRAARQRGASVIAVGTTVVRALESAAIASGEPSARTHETDLFIRPGFDFRVVDGLLTNFHAPRSTLLALVSAFAGHERTLAAYRHAVGVGYRFLSYGDAMWIPRRPGC